MRRRGVHWRRSAETMHRTLEHERQFAATEAGRRAQALRDQAQALQRIGRDEQAFELFRQAVECFPPDDLGPAAAAAWHDLGEGFRRRRVGSRMENLREAERWLRRALTCPARHADLRRRALSLNSLASTLHLLAGEVGHDTALIEEAKDLLTQAITLADGFGPIFGHERGRFLDSMGNLHLQLGQLEDAVHFNRRAIAAARERLLLFPKDHQERREWITFKCHLAHRLVLRGRRTDLREAISIATELRRHGPDSVADYVGLCEALARRAVGGAEELRRAREILETVRIEGIPAEHLHEYIDLLAELGRRDLAIDHLRNELHAAMSERRDAKSDYLADHASARAHAAGRRLARIHLDDGEPLAAFLALENTSGLRYEDALREYACVPFTPYGRALDELESYFRVVSALVDDMAGALAHLDANGQRELLSTFIAQPWTEGFTQGTSDAADRARDRLLRELLPRTLTEAQTGDPAATLRAFADDLARRAAMVKAAMTSHEPNLDPHPGGLGTAVDPDGLRALLTTEADIVLLRVSLAPENLLVVSVALIDGSLRATGRVFPVSPDLLLRTHRAAGALARLGEGVRPEDVAAFRRLNDSLFALDLSSLFPPGREDALVILPDQGAAMLPLGALGPPGATPIERFASVSWLPCLGPLRCRQVGTRQRSGQVTFAPNTETRAAEALAPQMADETLVWGEEATTKRLESTIAAADVVCLYTHGSHGHRRWPTLEMADGDFEMVPLQGGGWRGIERVEVWACESGVDLPTDPRGTPTNEFFGLDGMLLQHGVRSTIGTLWPVLDRVTAGIVGHYRRLLSTGLRADRALCASQRWWLREAAPEMLAQADDPEALQAIVESPILWAGYRFAGVCERRPLRVQGSCARLTAKEETEIETLLETLDEAPRPFSEAIEAALAALDDEVGSGSPTAEQALRAARLYRARLHSSYAHNQLCALAWLHEAERVAPAEQRPELTREAARLWLWLALRETPEAPALALQGSTRERQAAIQRARRLLLRLPVGSSAPEEAMLQVLEAAERGEKAALATAVRDACTRLMASASALDLGALAILCWIAASDVAAAGEHAMRLIAALGGRIDELSAEPEQFADASLLAWTGLLLARGLGQRPPIGGIDWRMLPAPMLVAAVVSRLHARAEERDATGREQMQELSEALTVLEGRLWDHPQHSGEDLWRSTGSTGAAYRRLAGWYLRGVAGHEHPERYVTVFGASLQYFADLRLLVQNRLAHVLGQVPDHAATVRQLFAHLAELLVQAGRRAEQLEAVALLPDVEGQRPMLDPFELTPDMVREAFTSIADAPAWELTQLAGERGEKPRSLAFYVVRQLESKRRQAVELWRTLTNKLSAGELWQLIQPVSDIEANQRTLAELPPDTCLLICMITPFHEVLMATLWRGRDGLQRRVSLRGEGLGVQLRHHLVTLLQPQVEELDGDCGPARGRAQSWPEISRLLAPQLAACLPPDSGGMRLAVFAPGCLRGLPWLRMATPGGPLSDRFAGLWQVPMLGWWPARTSPSGLACWLERAGEPSSTRFGEAVIAGLRARWPPQQVIGGVDDPGREFPEVQQVERAAELGLQRLRIYGNGLPLGISDATAGLLLGGQRPFVDRNFAGTSFGPGTEVELWAATPSLGDVSRVMLDHGDRLPGLVHTFLGAGAVAVLDLAWPVHDFVKAMVCEHFGLLRSTRAIEGAVALNGALRWCARLVSQLLVRRDDFVELPALLAFVDTERQRAALELLGDPTAIVALPRFSWTGEVAAWIDEVANPSHLAAFRWWGACDLERATPAAGR